MMRFLAGVASALILVAAGILWWKSNARADDPIPSPPSSRSMLFASAAEPEPPAASERTREEKRFDRYDKDRNGSIAREEYLASRRKAWAKLDVNGDGKLNFDEWAVRTRDKFADADADKNGLLTRGEFATTRAKRSASKLHCTCPNPGTQDAEP